MKEIIAEYSSRIDKVVRNIYRHLHQHPELSFEELETATLITQLLQDEAIPFQGGIGGHGIVARIEGRNPQSRIIGLRADMDALPIEEETHLPFKSISSGVMHACGHDAHTAMLLGTTLLLNQLRENFEGTVLCVFQPGEERHPGGARLMLQDGIFDHYKPELMLALHTNLDIPPGKISVSSGVIMASADEIHLTIQGRGGHGAMPHRTNDTILAASQIVVALQQIISRRRNPFVPAVLTFGKFIGNGATNVIPEKVFLSGTFRCMNDTERARLKKLIALTIEHTAIAHGCTCDTTICDGYPAVENDAVVTERVRQFASEYLGKENVVQMEPRMTSEDFGFFSAQIPSVFFRLGAAGDENQGCGGQHTSTFFIDESALQVGVGVMSHLALRFLNTTT